jgi:hypothetical protein
MKGHPQLRNPPWRRLPLTGFPIGTSVRRRYWPRFGQDLSLRTVVTRLTMTLDIGAKTVPGAGHGRQLVALRWEQISSSHEPVDHTSVEVPIWQLDQLAHYNTHLQKNQKSPPVHRPDGYGIWVGRVVNRGTAS